MVKTPSPEELMMFAGGHSLSSPKPWQSSICGNQHNMLQVDETQYGYDRSALDSNGCAYRHEHAMPSRVTLKTEQPDASHNRSGGRRDSLFTGPPPAMPGVVYGDYRVDISENIEEAAGGTNTPTSTSSAEGSGAATVAGLSAASFAADRIDIQSLQKLYHLRSSDAARSLCISQNTLKRLSEKFKIGRWPHRKLNSLLALQDHIEVSADISSPLRQELLSLVKSNYIDIVSRPDCAVHVRLEEMRRRMHKQDFVTRAKRGGAEAPAVSPAAPRGSRRGFHSMPLPVLRASPADRPALDPSSQAIIVGSPSSSGQLMAAAARSFSNLDISNSSAPAAHPVAGHVPALHQLPHHTAAGPVMRSDPGPHAMAFIELMAAPRPHPCPMPPAERHWTAGLPKLPTVQLPLHAVPGSSPLMMATGAAWLPCSGESLFGGLDDGREATPNSCQLGLASGSFPACSVVARNHMLLQGGFASMPVAVAGVEQRMAVGGRSSWHSGYDEAKALLAQDSSWPVDLSPAAPMAVDDDEEDPVNWIPRSLADS